MKLTTLITTILKAAGMKTVWEIIAQAVILAEEQGGTGTDKRKVAERMIKARLAQIKQNPKAFIINLLIELAVAQVEMVSNKME